MNCPKCNHKLNEMLTLVPIYFKAYECPLCGYTDTELLEENTPELQMRLDAFCKEIEKWQSGEKVK